MPERRPQLKLAKSPPQVPYSLLRRAARQFKGSYGPRKERHANIRKWIVAVQRLGNNWLLANPLPGKRKEA